jgi:hypothetical protein
MGIELKKGENVFYPAPYVPSEPAMIVITDKRVVYFGAEGRQEVAADKVSFVGRTSGRPFLVACIIMVLVGLPLAGWGAWMWYSVKDMKTFAESPPITEEVDYEDPAITRIKAIVIGGVGALLVAGAYFLIKKKRYIVMIRAGQELVRMIVPDEMKQTQILMTIEAMQKTVKAMKAGPPPSAAPPAKA